MLWNSSLLCSHHHHHHPQPLVRGEVTTWNELPWTAKTSSILLLLLFFRVFLCTCFVFVGKISQVSSSSSIFIIQNTLFLDGGGGREGMIPLSILQGRNAIKTFEYEVDTTLGSFNPASLQTSRQFNRHDSERRMSHLISNSTFVVEVRPDPIPLLPLQSLKISQLLRSLPELQWRPDCVICPIRAWGCYQGGVLFVP